MSFPRLCPSPSWLSTPCIQLVVSSLFSASPCLLGLSKAFSPLPPAVYKPQPDKPKETRPGVLVPLSVLLSSPILLGHVAESWAGGYWAHPWQVPLLLSGSSKGPSLEPSHPLQQEDSHDP
uniref:Uncharacterized protein n=1 Tax=Molossus molossus TaxID=27622 RepID=A0A7J8DC05_MOLMO|nr:hypothetical protein HJG59_009385 [Molossus molossus]